MGLLNLPEAIADSSMEELKEQAARAVVTLADVPRDKAIQAAYVRGAAIGFLSATRLATHVANEVESCATDLYNDCRKVYLDLGAPLDPPRKTEEPEGEAKA